MSTTPTAQGLGRISLGVGADEVEIDSGGHFVQIEIERDNFFRHELSESLVSLVVKSPLELQS